MGGGEGGRGGEGRGGDGRGGRLNLLQWKFTIVHCLSNEHPCRRKERV